MTALKTLSTFDDTVIREKTLIQHTYNFCLHGTLRVALCLFVLALWQFQVRVMPKTTYAMCTPEGRNIYTVDLEDTLVQCIVVRKSLIVDTGDLEVIYSPGFWRRFNTWLGFGINIHYANPGAIILPGITDSHVHTLGYGMNRLIPIEDAKSIPEVIALIRNFIVSNPEIHHDKNYMIEGWGWDHTKWPEGRWPNADDFQEDDIVADRPIYLKSKDGHAIWVSQTTLALNAPIPDRVMGGVIVRDDKGQPTGVLLDSAQAVIQQAPPTYKRLQQKLSLMVTEALKAGLTSVHDALLEPHILDFFRKEAQAGKLPIRIYGMNFFDPNGTYWGDTRERFHVGNRFTSRSVKIIADGALRTGGAALFEPYNDNPGTRGSFRTPPEMLDEIIPRFLRDGWQVNVHAIGDRANAAVLDAFERADKDDLKNLRPRVEHVQIIRPEDAARLGRLGVIASIQPTHATDDMWYAEDRLGPERIRNLYASRTIISSGARVTLGSDAPVEGVNPLEGFFAAITRVSKDGSSPQGPDGWFPDQKLTRLEALRGMTIDPAYASHSENILGSLECGKLADFVVLDGDIMRIPARDILDVKVLATIIGGEVVFGKLSL